MVRPVLLAVLLLPALLFLVPSPLLAWRGTVVEVMDADVLIVSRTDSTSLISLKLYGIEAPGEHNPYRNEAKRFVLRRTYGKWVEVTPLGAGDKGRTLAMVVTGGRLLNQELVANGVAWVDRTGCRRPECSMWQTLEDNARKSRTGLWGHPDAIPSFAREDGAGTDGAAGPYHGDLRKKVFHRPGCPEYDCFYCTAVFQTREEAIRAGYKPDPVCKP